MRKSTIRLAESAECGIQLSRPVRQHLTPNMTRRPVHKQRLSQMSQLSQVPQLPRQPLIPQTTRIPTHKQPLSQAPQLSQPAALRIHPQPVRLPLPHLTNRLGYGKATSISNYITHKALLAVSASLGACM